MPPGPLDSGKGRVTHPLSQHHLQWAGLGWSLGYCLGILRRPGELRAVFLGLPLPASACLCLLTHPKVLLGTFFPGVLSPSWSCELTNQSIFTPLTQAGFSACVPVLVTGPLTEDMAEGPSPPGAHT